MLHALGLGGVDDLLLFMTAVLVLNATPGVDFALTLARTLQGGARAGMAAALGICSGAAVHVAVAAFGLAALLAASAAAFTLLKWLGALYLLWLAFGMARAAWRGSARPAVNAVRSRARGADFRAGLLTNVLNPKVALFALAFVPQFIAPGTPDKTLAFLGLGALFVVQSAVFLFVLVALAARLRRLPAPASAGRWLNGIGAALFAALAVRLIGVKA